jgi:anti-anti-sigma factor
MELTRRQERGVEVVVLRGRLDALTSNGVEHQILGLIDGGVRRMIVEMQEVTYVSSVGFRVLLVAAMRLRGQGGGLVVSALQPPVREAYEFGGFGAVCPAFACAEEARERWS